MMFTYEQISDFKKVILTQIERHTGLAETALNDVIESTATYEIIENVLINNMQRNKRSGCKWH